MSKSQREGKKETLQPIILRKSNRQPALYKGTQWTIFVFLQEWAARTQHHQQQQQQQRLTLPLHGFWIRDYHDPNITYNLPPSSRRPCIDVLYLYKKNPRFPLLYAFALLHSPWCQLSSSVSKATLTGRRQIVLTFPRSLSCTSNLGPITPHLFSLPVRITVTFPALWSS